MSWFCTKAFSFELPGTWEERTVQIHQRPDEKAALMITRNPRDPEVPMNVETAIAGLPSAPGVEREVLRSEWLDSGDFQAHDVSVMSRNRKEAEYHRIVCVAYYDLELSFQFAGTAGARAEVDARVDHALSTVRFRRR